MKLYVLPFQAMQDNQLDLLFEIYDDYEVHIDVSTGWDARLVVGSLNQPDRAGLVMEKLTADMTMIFGQVGIRLTAADLNAIHAGTYAYALYLSDDAFVANNFIAATGQLQIVPSIFGLA